MRLYPYISGAISAPIIPEAKPLAPLLLSNYIHGSGGVIGIIAGSIANHSFPSRHLPALWRSHSKISFEENAGFMRREVRGRKARLKIISTVVAQATGDTRGSVERQAKRLLAFDALRNLETLTHSDDLEGLATVFQAYKELGAFHEMTVLYESARDSRFRGSEPICELYLMALNRTGRHEDALSAGTVFVEQGLRTGPVFAAMGKTCRQLARRANDPEAKRVALVQSYYYYQQGYLIDFHYHQGINLVYNLVERGEEKRALALAKLVARSALMAGGKTSDDYCCRATLLELAVIRGDKKEAVEMLPRVMRKATSEWELDSTLSQLRMLKGRRTAAGKSGALEEFVISRLEARRQEVLSGQVSAGHHGSDDLGESEAVKVGRAIAKKGFHYAGIYGHYVPGNADFGGKLHDQEINRRDFDDAIRIIGDLGLSGTRDFETWDRAVNAYVEERLRLADPKTGERWMEKLHHPRHLQFEEARDAVWAIGATEFAGGTRTSLMMDLAFGWGDCRQAAEAKQLLYDAWEYVHGRRWMGQAYQAFKQKKFGQMDGYLEKVDDVLLPRQLYVFDVTAHAGVTMRKMYDFVRDGEGRAIATGTVVPTEEHTMNVLIEWAKDGSIANMEIRDAFYHDVYKWQKFVVEDPAAFLRDEGLPAGTMRAVDSEGKTVDVPVFLKPTVYAGKREKRVPNDLGFRWFRGHVAPFDYEMIKPGSGWFFLESVLSAGERSEP